MGMTIEEFEEYAKSHNILTMTRELYENRLKADMVAMLENLRLRADETQGHKYNSDFWEGFYTYDDIIKAEINALKENT